MSTEARLEFGEQDGVCIVGLQYFVLYRFSSAALIIYSMDFLAFFALLQKVVTVLYCTIKRSEN